MHTNFWPENLEEETASDLMPKAILSAAAKELAARTGGKVEGEVRSRAIGDKLEHSFYVRSTDVDYRYLLFKVRHAIDGFPVELLDLGRDGIEPTELAGRAEFEDALRAIFGRNSTRSVVARMRDLAREVG